MSLPVILAFGAMFGWGIGDFLIQRTVKELGELETLCWISLFSSCLLIPFIFRELRYLQMSQVLLLSALGIVNFASGWVHFTALKVGKLSVVETIMSIELPLTIILGIIYFKESLSPAQIGLIVSLFIGTVLISVDFKGLRKNDFLEKGSLLAILSGTLIALVNFFTASQAKTISPLMSIWLPWLVCGLICLALISRKRLRKFARHSLDHSTLVITMVAIDLFAWLAYVFSVSRQELAITIAITESYIVIALVLGILLNRERIGRWQYLGAAMAITSSLVMGYIS